MAYGISGAGIDWATSKAFIYIGIAIGLILLAGLVVLLIKMRTIRRECRETIAKKYTSGDILCHNNLANYYGMEVHKGKQKRGNGVLILAQNELYFLRLQPKLEITIPLKRIKRVLTPSSFLGKSAPKPLLKVDFKDENGVINSVAWLLQDLESFKNCLKPQIKKTRAKIRK
jgi:hypothetical protein